ncbi:MAG: VWA domain-containing protein, partial [Bacteroidia bacterium]|nr:VWA domain-containing protein [Bacteroidia bacterium]
RNTLIAMKKEDKNSVFEQLPLMETALADLRQNQAAYLAGITSSEVINQYETTVRKAEVFIKITKDFIENPFIEPKYTPYGIAYYNFNNYFLNNYNRYGAGLVNDFNKFVEISEVPLLKVPEEVHWLKILPKPYRNDLPVKEEPVVKKDTLKIIVEADPEPEKPKVEEPVIVVKDSVPPAQPVIEPSVIAGAAPVNMVLLLDVSGSMQKPYKFPLLKNSFRNLLGLLRDYDQVSIVVYSGNARVVLNPTICTDKKKILETLELIETSGKSDVLKGIKLAYKVAENHYLPNGNNRIILATDGGIDLGEELTKLISENSNNYDIFLSVFYYEEQEFQGKADKLRQIAVKGKGNYAYINQGNADEMMIKEVNSVRKK